MSHLPVRAVALLLCIAAFPFAARAQEPQVIRNNHPPGASPPFLDAVILPPTLAAAPLDPPVEPPPDRWKVKLDFGFTGTSGNQNLMVLTSGAQLTHLQTEKFEFEVSGQTRYGRSDGAEVARNLRGGIKLDLQPQATWSPFVFSTLEQDPFRKLDVRANGGTGIKYTLTQSEDTEASLSMAGLYSYEQLGGDLEPGTDPNELNGRWSFRFRGRRELNSSVQLNQTTFYQPVWSYASDYLLEAETSVAVKMTQSMALQLSHSYERNSTPPVDVSKDDHLVQVGLSMEI